MQQQSSFDTLLTLDDNALLNLISEGNDDAVSALVLRYLSLVRKKVSGIHLASMDADDLTQEGVIGLMDAIRTYRKDGGSSFATYASTCVDNRIRKAIAHANTGKNRAFASSLTLDEAPVTMLADQAENPEAIVIAKERLQMLQKKMDLLLSQFEREVLSCYLKGLNYDQMAQSLHTSKKAIDNALQRVRRKLRIAVR